MTTKIIMVKQIYGYKAFIGSTEGKSVFGKTFFDALGGLVYSFPDDFDCVITEEETT